MTEPLPPELQLASHDDISELVGVVLEKLGSISTHAEIPKPPLVLPEELVRRVLRNFADQNGLTEEQALNLPRHPLVELIPVDDLDRLAIRHFGFEAGMPPNHNVAAVVRSGRDDGPVASAHIMETRSGRLRMIMDSTVLRTDVPCEPIEPAPHAIRDATLADCIELTRQINASPDSRY